MVDNEEPDVLRIWRLHKTALQLCYDRGYAVPQEDLNQSFDNFKFLYGERPRRSDLTIQVATMSDDSSGHFFVFFPDDLRAGVNFINEVVGRMRENNSKKAIIIVRESINSSAKELISQLSSRFHFEIFSEAELIENVADADFAAEVFNEEKADLMSRYKYGDFHTIDWPRDLARDRMRHKFIATQKRDLPIGWMNAIWDAGSGWVCVLLVGIAAGAVAGIIDIGARWMSDLKDGICADRFWLDREHCCWSANESVNKENDCDSWTSWPEMFEHYDNDYLYKFVDFLFYVFWGVLMAGLSVAFVRTFAPYACGSGIPEIKCILSGFVIRGYLGKWTFLIKSVGLILSSASGLSLGKEGPMVHLACCIGNIFTYVFPKYGLNEAKKREILSASAAAGVSVAFGAPIGGVLFSLEEASYYFPLKTMWRSFFCALIAGVVLRFVNPFGSDQTSLFHVDYSMKWTFMELIPFALLGIFGGLLGSFFIWANIKWCTVRRTNPLLARNPIYEVLLVMLVTGSVAFFNPYTRKSASSLIKQLFDRCGPEDYDEDLCDYHRNFTTDPINKVDDNYHTGDFGQGVYMAILKLSLALLTKLLFTIFTFGIKVPSGLFVPSLAMGAIAGRILGIKVEGLVYTLQKNQSYGGFWTCQIGKDCVMPGLYAMVGAAAVLGGVTRMTVSLVVIMFELTGSLEFIVPTMAAVMFAKWVGDAIYKKGIYDAHIELNGYPFLDNKDEYPYTTMAAQVMRPGPDRTSELKVIEQNRMTVGELETLLRDTNYAGFPVVVSGEENFVVGYCARRDIQMALKNARKTHPYVTTNSRVFFSSANFSGGENSVHSPGFLGSSSGTTSQGGGVNSGPATLNMRKTMDRAPMTVTDQTPMETIIDMFRKLGLRQVLVTKRGRLLGIITKKDILRFMHEEEA